MEEPDRKLAEDILNRLMQGSAVSGLRFFTPQLLLDGPKDIPQGAYINLSSEWDIYDKALDDFPASFSEVTLEEEEMEIHRLRGDEVDRISILSPWPHLVVYFKSGRVLYMNGKDDNYEPWTAGLTSLGNVSETWLVVACPGGNLAICVPDSWRDIKNV